MPMFPHSHWDGHHPLSRIPDAFSLYSRALPCPPPSTFHPAGEGAQGDRAPGNGHHREASVHQNLPCCPGNGSCPRRPRHPWGQLVSVGGGFHGSSPVGVQRGFRRGQGPAGPFSFVLGTLGLCSRWFSLKTRPGPWVCVWDLGLDPPHPVLN